MNPSLDGPSRLLQQALLRCLRTAACVAVLGAPSLAALAQAPADPRETEQPASPAEPSGAAQPDNEPPPVWNHRHKAPSGVDGQLRRLAADLNLDAGQQQKIRPILLAQREQMQRLQRDSGLAAAERQKRILALGDRSAEQIRAQLTDAQRAQYIQPRTKSPAPASPVRRGSTAASTPGTTPGKEVKP
jgi:hypothetical protein